MPDTHDKRRAEQREAEFQSAVNALGGSSAAWVLYLIGRLSVHERDEAERIAQAIAQGKTPFNFSPYRPR